MKNKIIFSLLTCSSLVFGSEVLTFSKAYNLTLANSKDLKVIEYQSDSIKEQLNQQKASLYPQANLSATVGKNDYELNHRQKRLDYDVDGNPLNVTLSVSQVVYDPEVKNKIDTQKTRIKIYNTKVSKQKQELAQKALKIYSDILKSKNRIKLLKSYISYNKSLYETIENKYSLKLANKMDLLEQEVQYNNSKIELQKEQMLLKVHKTELYNLIGRKGFRYPDIDLTKIKSTNIKKMQKIASKNIDKISSLEIQEALLNLELAKKQTKSAYNEYKPKVYLQATYTKYNANDESAYYDNTKTIALNFKLPLYQGGYTKSKVLSSKLNEKANLMNLESVKDQVRVEYAKNLAIFNSSVDSLNLFKDALDSAKTYYEAIKEGYESGLKDKSKLYDAKSKIYEVKFKYMQSLYDMMDSFITLLILSNDFNNLKCIDRLFR